MAVACQKFNRSRGETLGGKRGKKADSVEKEIELNERRGKGTKRLQSESRVRKCERL